MKKLFIAVLCFCSLPSFAQNGFFLQPEIGAGISNTIWKPSSSIAIYPGQKSVFSYQGQVDIGYKAGKWQFISGIGYLRTGVKLQNGTMSDFRKDIVTPLYLPVLENFLVPFFYRITDYNPHFILPVKVGYEFHRFNNNLSFTPLIGAELAYNMPRTFIYAPENEKEVESAQSFSDNCNQYAVIGILQLNFEYRLNNRYDLTVGPSIHYMFTSELNFADEHDYAVLMNLGLKWNFKKRKQTM